MLQPVAVDGAAQRVEPPVRSSSHQDCNSCRIRAEHHALDAADAAEHDHHKDHHRDREAEHFRCRGLQFGDIEHAGHAGEGGADGEREQFELVRLTPIAAAAISSSRIAIQARPMRESRNRMETKTSSATMAMAT